MEVWSDGELDFSNDGVAEYARACIEEANALGVPALDFHTIMNDLSDQERHACQYDGLHFNVKGHALVAEKLLTTIEKEFPTVAKRLDAWEHPDYFELIAKNVDKKKKQ
ncbi:GDSL esterase/lipase [Phytophthora cinnamomi]|uniref:GDSL esterase/lipase n=1 Tax=Phytophthora cinnamomi TaxID=4785 RepID=UPI00355A1AD6|nr:GDSL esterase/lipase [Phytophthora cinnamomi]